MTPSEEWRPVVGYEDRYEVSNLGRVRYLTAAQAQLARETEGDADALVGGPGDEAGVEPALTC